MRDIQYICLDTSEVKKVIFLILILSVAFANTAQASPKYEDFYRPIIKSLTIDIPVTAKTKADGGYTYPLKAFVDLTVRIHANTLTGFAFYLRNYQEVRGSTPCQSLHDTKISIGNSNYTGGEGNLAPLTGLLSRVSDSDWFLEKYRFEIPINSNSFLKPCIGKYDIQVIHLRDIASHHKSILLNYGTPVPFYESLGRFDSDWKLLPLPENACPLTTNSEFRSMPTACVENLNQQALGRTFKQEEIELAEREEDKTVAELKQKKELEAKLALERSIAEQKSKQEAEAKAKTASEKLLEDAKAEAAKILSDAKSKAQATLKKTTITCVKGKLTKKVTAVKPKCPSGYKLKK
jgi:hypothetical protein